MRKLTLDMDLLQVEPFEVEPIEEDGPAFGPGATLTQCVGSFSEPYAYCLRQPDTASCYC